MHTLSLIQVTEKVENDEPSQAKNSGNFIFQYYQIMLLKEPKGTNCTHAPH